MYSDCNVLVYITFCRCEMSFLSCKDHQSQDSRNYIVFLHIPHRAYLQSRQKDLPNSEKGKVLSIKMWYLKIGFIDYNEVH